MRKLLSQRIFQRVAFSIVWAAFGQGFDVWTTKLGVANGAREMNPLFRGMVGRRQYGKLLAIKYGVVGIAAMVNMLAEPPAKRSIAAAGYLRTAGTVGFLAGCWNLCVIFRRRRLMRRAQTPEIE